MKHLTPLGALTLATVLGFAVIESVRAAGSTGPEDAHFSEILRLIRANLPGVTEEDLNRAMVGGLVEHFRPRVELVASVTNAGPTNLVRRSAVMEGGLGYVGVRSVGAGLGDELAGVLAELGRTQSLRGLILDLRFAGGMDYRAAAEVADRFVPTEGQALLKWEGTELKSTAKTNAWVLPGVVLVNGGTAGAPEALAAALRENSYALLVGSRTAGHAQAEKGFPLGDGRELRIATSTLVAGEDVELSGPLTPDIEVLPLAEDLERTWLEDPYRTNGVVAGVTNRSRLRMNEAELVRRRDPTNPPGGVGRPAVRPPATVAQAQPERVLQDVALARAMDLLRGLAAVGRPGRK